MKKLRIHYFQHVQHEGLGSIEEWISSSGHLLTSTRFFENSRMPEISDIDWLIIMGGPMSVNDEEQFSWLADEKKFIRQSIEADKTILGICLGSQLVSAALGARVYKNREKEIGWFDIKFTPIAQSGNLFSHMGEKLKVFHWHGDTFDLPENAVQIASSEGCTNQAYIYKNNVLAFQFHLEPTPDSLNEMIDRGRSDLTSGNYVQTEEELNGNKNLLVSNKEILFTLLNKLTEQ
jgi:GMP synthase-like glutamine amidotransferase